MYLGMNYGFVVMAWKYNGQVPGILMTGLVVLQIGINIWANHPQVLRKIPFLRGIA
jgi:hypothetical protein